LFASDRLLMIVDHQQPIRDDQRQLEIIKTQPQRSLCLDTVIALPWFILKESKHFPRFLWNQRKHWCCLVYSSPI
jgi:hypothetical protein